MFKYPIFIHFSNLSINNTKIYIDTVEQVSGWTEVNGLITFGVAPGLGEVITADFDFYVPVRFDTDFLDINLEMYQHGTAEVNLVELRVWLK